MPLKQLSELVILHETAKGYLEAAKKGVIKKNNASRKLSRMAKAAKKTATKTVKKVTK